METPFNMGASATGPNGPVALDTAYTIESAELQFGYYTEMFNKIFHSLEELTKVQDYIEPLPNDEAFSTLRDSLYETIQSDIVSVEGIGDKLRAVVEYIATTLNTAATAVSKLLMSGLPFFDGIIKKAKEIKERLKTTDSLDRDIPVKDFGGLVLGNEFIHPDQLSQQLELLSTITQQLLSKEKLETFNTLTDNVILPFYQVDIKWKKTDEFIFLLGIFAALTNPAIPVGMVLKEIFSAVSPNAMGKAIDAGTTLAGMGISKMVTGGLSAILPSLGSVGVSRLRDISRGRLDISLLPKYQSTVYTFCTNQQQTKNSLLSVFQSPVLLGNRQWEVTDYIDVITANMKVNTKGTIGKTGASFNRLKISTDIPSSVPSLSTDQIAEICDTVVDMFTVATDYAKLYPKYSRSYNQHFLNVSKVVHDKLNGNYLRDTYVRYTYRNAMNLILGSMWKNCYGADNQYLRYLLSISKQLLRYCEQSLSNDVDQNS